MKKSNSKQSNRPISVPKGKRQKRPSALQNATWRPPVAGTWRVDPEKCSDLAPGLDAEQLGVIAKALTETLIAYRVDIAREASRASSKWANALRSMGKSGRDMIREAGCGDDLKLSPPLSLKQTSALQDALARDESEDTELTARWLTDILGPERASKGLVAAVPSLLNALALLTITAKRAASSNSFATKRRTLADDNLLERLVAIGVHGCGLKPTLSTLHKPTKGSQGFSHEKGGPIVQFCERAVGVLVAAASARSNSSPGWSAAQGPRAVGDKLDPNNPACIAKELSKFKRVLVANKIARLTSRDLDTKRIKELWSELTAR